jgi:hypothetical protein
MIRVTSQLKLLGQLLAPSWLSGLLSVIVGLAVVAGTVAALHYNGSNIQLLQQTQANQPHAISKNSDSLNDGFTANQFISDIPLLILWAGVGLIAYSLTMQIIKIFTRAVNLEQEMNYVHTDRHQLLRQTLLRFSLRVLILLTWLLYIRFTIHVLVPYVIALAYAGSGGLGWLADAGYLLGATGLMIIGCHLHAIMLRLILLRPRAFGQLT